MRVALVHEWLTTPAGSESILAELYALYPQAQVFSDPNSDLAASYRELASLAPILAEHQAAGDVHGFVLDKAHPSVDFTANGYALHVALDEIFGHGTDAGYGLIMADGPERFIGAGKGFRVSFSPINEKTAQLGLGPSTRAFSRTESGFPDGA